jgi:two-component system chemotaxis response regulator CheB
VTAFDDVHPDVVILDVEMPELDGLSALPLLLRKRSNLTVIMASALTRKHAEHSLKALSLGAADYVPKPGTSRDMATAEIFRRELTEKVRHLALRQRRRSQPASSADGSFAHNPLGLRPANSGASRIFRLRKPSTVPPRAIVIGASTGGPQAVTQLLTQLAPACRQTAILVVLHMPPTFTTIFAAQLARATGMPAHEPDTGEAVQPGQIYVAPGGRHMLLEAPGGNVRIVLDDGPPEHFCRPAIDPLFASAGQIWGAEVAGVILTGMGSDGTRGAAAIADAGGSVIAQDEATSAIWGMPGSAALAGVCASVLPLDQIAPKLRQMLAERGS